MAALLGGTRATARARGVTEAARSRASRLRRLVRAGAAAAAIALIACASVGPSAHASDYNAYQASRLFAAGFTDVAKIYIDEVAVPEMAMAGLGALSRLDRDLSVVESRARIEVRLDGRIVGTFRVPGAQDLDGWGAVTAGAIDLGLTASDRLAEHSAETIYAHVFDAMLADLDAYSRYAGAEAARQNRASRDGFGGIGARVRAGAEGIDVLSVRRDGPADKAGLRAGDTIVRIDGAPAAALAQREAIDRLRGHVDSTLSLTIRRADRRLAFNLRRAHIVPETVSARAEGDLAVIEISGFNQDTAESLEHAVRDLQDSMAGGPAGYVIDLRGNPGGLLDQAVDVADLFVGQGRLLSTHGRHPDSHQYFTARPDDIARGRPLVVLIDSGSASAAEIVAAAIQDQNRGLVVGALSYGKGTVQTVLRLPNRGELTLTWARFHAPSGYALAGRGVTPDVCTSRHPNPTLEAVLADLAGPRGPEPGSRDPAKRLDDTSAIPLAPPAAACPRRPGGAPADMAIARRLLHDRDLYRTAAAEQGPAIAQAAR
jgi:carboxyl-terminal processing protease